MKNRCFIKMINAVRDTACCLLQISQIDFLFLRPLCLPHSQLSLINYHLFRLYHFPFPPYDSQAAEGGGTASRFDQFVTGVATELGNGFAELGLHGFV